MKRFFATLIVSTICLAVSPALKAETSFQSLSINQWVRSVDGVVKGRVVVPMQNGGLEAVSEVEVLISRRDGQSFRVTTNDQGQFEVGNVESGVYSLAVWRDRVLAACALQVIDESHDPDGRYPASAMVSVADVDRPTIKTAIIRYLPAGVRTAPQFFSGINFSDMVDKVRPSGNMLRIAQTNGGLRGRLFLAGATGSELQAAPLSNVFILKDGDQVERALTDDQGQFVIDQLMPGMYSMLAVGPGGVGLIGFELTSDVSFHRSASHSGDATEQLVSKLQEAPEELSMQLAPVPEAIESVDSLMEEDVEIVEAGEGVPLEFEEVCFEEPVLDACCAPVSGGGFHGGGGGGGGGGGFGGGFGGLAGLAAIAAVAASDSDCCDIPPAASPAIPVTATTTNPLPRPTF